MIRIKQKTVRANRPDKENRAWAKWIRQAKNPEDDIQLLVQFYKLPHPKEPDERWNRKKALPQIFNNLEEQIQLAEALRDRSPGLFQTKRPVSESALPEPEGWQAHAPGKLGRKTWNRLCIEYPEIAKELADQLK